MHYRSLSKAVISLIALSPLQATAFTASIGSRRSLTTLTALEVDDVTDAVKSAAPTNNDDFVVDNLEEQHSDWEADMAEIHNRLDNRVDFPVQQEAELVVVEEEKEASTATVAPQELVMEVQEIAAAPVAETANKSTEEETVIIPVESTTLRAEAEMSSNVFMPEPVLELTGPGVNTLEHLEAKLATAQRVIDTVSKENQDLKKERGLLRSDDAPSEKRPLQRLASVISRKTCDVVDSALLLEVTHKTIAVDSILRLSMLVSTAQRTIQTLLQENRDLKCSSYGPAGVSLAPAHGVEEFVVAAATDDDDVAVVNKGRQQKRKVISGLFKGAASIASKPFHKSSPEEDTA